VSDHQPAMGPEALRIVTAILDSIESEPTPSPEALARFALGWSGPEERDRVIEAMTASPALRKRTLTMFDEVQAAEPRDPVLVRMMEEYLPGSIDRFRRTALGDWSPEALNNNPIYRGVLAAIGRRLTEFTEPVAEFRGDDRSGYLALLPASLSDRRHWTSDSGVHAVLDDHGDLMIVNFLEETPQPGQRFIFVLRDAVAGTIPLGTPTVEGIVCMLRIPGFCKTFSLPLEPMPGAVIDLVIGGPTEAPFDSWVVTLEQPGGGEDRIRIPFTGMPKIEEGRLTIPLSVPPGIADSLSGETLNVLLLGDPAPLPLGSMAWSEVVAKGKAEFALAANPGPLHPSALELRVFY